MRKLLPHKKGEFGKEEYENLFWQNQHNLRMGSVMDSNPE